MTFDPIALARAAVGPGFVEFRQQLDAGSRIVAINPQTGQVAEVTLAGDQATVRKLDQAEAMAYLGGQDPGTAVLGG